MRTILLKGVHVNDALGKYAAELEIDGKHTIRLAPGMEFVIPGTEIVEEGISNIELAASSQWNRDFQPFDGNAKWFRDELGQIWVKFQTARIPHPHDTEERVVDRKDHVWPADRVVCVTYEK